MSQFNAVLEPTYKGLTEQNVNCYQRQKSWGAVKNGTGLALPGEIYNPDSLLTLYNFLLCMNFHKRKKCSTDIFSLSVTSESWTATDNNKYL